jgi:hypothetical protein
LESVVDQARRHRHAVVALAIAAILALLHGPVLVEHVLLSADAWRFADDVRVLIHPLFRAEDPGVFPGDPSVEYFLKSLPDGYHLLYDVLGPLVGVAFFSKLLPYLLLGVTLACIGFVAGRLSGAAAVLGALSLALGSAYLLGRMAGGLPRSFALPLFAAGAALLAAGRVKSLALLVVLGAGFYPVAALVLGATLALLLFLPFQDRGSARDWSTKRRVAVVVVTAALAGAVLLPSLLRLGEYGSAITPRLWPEFPEAGPGGRFDPVDRPPFPPLPEALAPPLVAALVGAGEPFFRALNLRGHGGVAAASLALFALLAWLPLALRHPAARRLLLLLTGVVVCHTVSLAAGLRLFIPERYVAYGVPVLALIMIPAALGALASAKRRWLRALPIAYNIGLLVLVGARGAPWTGLTVAVPEAERSLYRAIQQLPASAVIAGFPGEAIDNVPYLTRRAAFVTRETQMPFHTVYTLRQRERTRAFLRAYYATTEQTLREFQARFRVTHLLLDRRHFLTRPTYYAPFDPDVARAFDAMKLSGSAALASLPRTQVFESSSFVLLELGKL